MSTISPPTTKKIRRCFFVSLAFVIVVPLTCIVLGVTLHPTEFQYNPPDPSLNRTIFLHADLISADVKQGSMVLEWIVTGDSCASCTDVSCAAEGCSNVNIYFDSNLLHSDSGNSKSTNNRPVDPTFVWNATASYNDEFGNIPSFQTELAVIPPLSVDYSQKHLVRHTRSSEVYYPFDRYLAEIFGYAEDATTNATVSLDLDTTSGLAVGLKISADTFQNDDPNIVYVEVTLQRGTLVIWHCLVITITFWLVTLTICLLMIMTIGFGFQQRNEIVVVPVSTVFAFTQLRSSMPGAPDGFGDILDFVGVLPCLVLLSISAVTMVGIYLFTDPSKDSREKLTWSALVEALSRHRNRPVESLETKDTSAMSYGMLPLSTSENASPGDLSSAYSSKIL
ncbi:hypothetical protein IW261DRAFT_1565690 [Armillaria novae-zelandiae]|uniref:Uncharacterized protein n=1 Tax=Armillaria novae-zelandiae TaxID=153914 RepID=A0AA39P678_9AGAR|nr:hypothetical protein IW261DRAFT_1565690 [Armillaria novae-zelandiae]